MLRSISLLLLAFIVQSSIGDSLTIFSARPDFILLILIYTGLTQGALAATMLGWTFGLLQDFYGPVTNLGLNALCKTVIGYLAGLGKDGLYKDSLPNLAGILFIAILLHDLLYFFIDTQYDLLAFVTMLWRHTLPTGLYTTLIGIVLAVGIAYRRGRFNARRIFPE